MFKVKNLKRAGGEYTKQVQFTKARIAIVLPIGITLREKRIKYDNHFIRII